MADNGSPISVVVNGKKMGVTTKTTVAAAVAQSVTGSGIAFRKSVAGEPRAPLCGMGICFECRVTIDGRANQRSCNILCREGMEVSTDAV